MMPDIDLTSIYIGRASLSAANLERFRIVIEESAARYDFEPAIIAAIMSRESNGEVVIGDGGHGFGVAQIDKRSYPRWTLNWRLDFERAKTEPDLEKRTRRIHELGAQSIKMGAWVLAEKRRVISRLFPALEPKDLLRASIAAYNTGQGNVARMLRAGRDVDSTTTGRDYSKDVLIRATWFHEHGWMRAST